MKTAIRTFAACLVLGLASGAPAQQNQVGRLDGAVTDSSGAVLSGVRILAASPQMIGGSRRAETDAGGRYHLVALVAGTYEVTASIDGFRTVRYPAVELPPGLGLTLDFHLEVAPIAAEIVVRGTSAAIDVHRSAASTMIDRQLLENVPFDPRGANGYPGLAAGINRGVAYGGTQRINSFSIDGTLGTDPTTGAVSTAPNVNWLEEVQIASLGAGASQGEYTGSHVNAITRSGGNRYSATAEYITTRTGWTGDNRGSLPPDLTQRFKPLEIFEWWDATAQLGGPALRDHLWFFSGLEYAKSAQRPFSFAGVPRTKNEPTKLSRDPRLLLKLTGAPSSALRLEGFVSLRRSRTVNGNASPLVRPEALSTATFPEHMQNARLTWLAGARTLVEARYGQFWLDPVNGPTPPASTSGPPTHFDRFTGVRSGNVAAFGDAWQRVSSIQASVTQQVGRTAAGSHQIEAGLEREWAREVAVVGYPGGIAYSDVNGAPDLATVWAGSTARGTQHRTSVFAQDRWELNDRLTIEPGLRINGYASAVPAPITAYQNSSVSARLGVAWALAPDHRSVARAHYGHYDEGLVTGLYDFLDPLTQAPMVTARVLGPGQFQEITRTSLTGISIDPGVKHAFVEEFVGGMERDAGAHLSVGVQAIRRQFKDSFGIVGPLTNWTPVSVTDPGPDGVAGTADDGPSMTVYNNPRPQGNALVLTNPPGAWRRYHAVQIFATRRRANGWELQASYTWSRTQGSFDNDFGCCGNVSSIGVNGIFVNPNRALFSVGQTTLDRTHDVKVLGTYAVPYWGGLRVSAIYRYLSGAPWARTADFGPLTQAVGLIRVEPVGAHILPAIDTLDLRVEKIFRVPGAATLGLYIDVFNVGNQGIPTSVNTLSGANFALPTGWLDPRTVHAALRLTF